MITPPFAEIKTNLLCPEDNYTALPNLFSSNCIFYNTLFVVVIRKELFIKKSDIQTFFSFKPFLTKERVFSQMQIVNIYNWKTKILKVAQPYFNSSQYLHEYRTPLNIYITLLNLLHLLISLIFRAPFGRKFHW